IISTNVRTLIESLQGLLRDPERAAAIGRRARRYACERYGLERFVADWDHLFEEIVC
ncbi:MAG: glycosyltransferase family 1 protein, partial [Candidatus Eremiobacteraeota bacterium]|nr:glycosyltransferase family 1 protein [Candidatus Eremiobacteraeota bacterium]